MHLLFTHQEFYICLSYVNECWRTMPLLILEPPSTSDTSISPTSSHTFHRLISIYRSFLLSFLCPCCICHSHWVANFTSHHHTYNERKEHSLFLSLRVPLLWYIKWIRAHLTSKPTNIIIINKINLWTLSCYNVEGRTPPKLNQSTNDNTI